MKEHTKYICVWYLCEATFLLLKYWTNHLTLWLFYHGEELPYHYLNVPFIPLNICKRSNLMGMWAGFVAPKTMFTLPTPIWVFGIFSLNLERFNSMSRKKPIWNVFFFLLFFFLEMEVVSSVIPIGFTQKSLNLICGFSNRFLNNLVSFAVQQKEQLHLPARSSPISKPRLLFANSSPT